MLDLWSLPDEGQCDVAIFNRPCQTTNLEWESWRKPRGVRMVYILNIGGGGGGGGGFTAIAGSARGGGGGGGSSAQTISVFPAFLLPDVLFVQVGKGGLGVGSGGGTAGSGVLSYVAVRPDTTGNNVVSISGAAAAAGGTTGTGAAAGTGGTAGTAASVSGMCFTGLASQAFVVAGQGGANGGAQTGAVGASITFPTTGLVTTGGAGGAGVTGADFAGGAFNATANTLISDYRPVAPAAGSNNGSGGPTLWKPLFNYGGCGGSASNAGVGGQGGIGAYGCGGGGGGGGTTGGTGGNGGSGLVIIIAW